MIIIKKTNMLKFFCLLALGVFCLVGASSADTAMGTVLQEKLEIPISLDLRDMNVVDVYKFLAVKGDFNISISKDIKGRVTLYLNEVSIKDTLDIVSVSNNLGYKVVGENIIHIMTEQAYRELYGQKFGDQKEVKIVYIKYAKPAYVLEALKNIKSDLGRVVIDGDTGSVVMIDTKEHIAKMEKAIDRIDHPLDMKIISLKYADAQTIAAKLRKELDNKSVGSIEADDRSNKLIIKAFPGRMSEIVDMVNALDSKTKAVLIQVRILKLTLNPKFDMGIDWETMFKSSKYLDFKSYFPISSAVSSYAQIAVGNFDVNDWSVELKASKEISNTKVLANPSLMVVNNKEARIHIGDKLAYVTTTTIGAGDSQRTNEEIHYIDVGVQFTVVPTINDDGMVTMRISPEISSRSGTLTTPQGAEVPLINSTLVETDVIVQDGETIVIGGLKENKMTDSDKGIPFLMDIPFIGKAFTSTSKNDTKTEIVILLTPHIIDENNSNFADNTLKKKTQILKDKEY